MKKVLIISAAAVLALVSCAKVTDQYVGAPESHEIGFMAVTSPNTKAAIDGTGFPTALNMMVTAYQVEATGGAAAVYFDATPFTYQFAGGALAPAVNATYWGGNPAKYWPLTPAYINFLAIANANADNATDVTWGTNKADQVTIVMSDNSSAQRDLMYAIGNGAVTQPSGNALLFPTKVDMEFLHAQAWIDFKVKAKTTVETAITLNSITLNGGKYAGTYAITHTNYNAKASQSVAGAWSSLGAAKNVDVPGWSANTLTTDFVTVGNGLMIVPDDAATDDFDSFTINYTYDSKDYTYTYTPASKSVDQKKHYIYEITFQLHEIFINPTVDDWKDQSATELTIQ